MEVRPGYKQTEVGVIPTDWDVKTIEQLAFVTSGKRLPLGSSLVDHSTPHPYIRVTDMTLGTVSLSDIRFVPKNVFPAIKKYRIYRNDIFISVAGTLGIVGKVPVELDGANLTENADRITDISCSQDFLLYVLMSPLIQNTIDSIRTVGAQPKLALTRIRKFAVPLPPTEAEQRAIAAALSDVDALLEGLTRLIAKKRDLKQAAMQQLLTGQTRLPGFHGEWEVRTVAEVASVSKGAQLHSSDSNEAGQFPHYNGGISASSFTDKANTPADTIAISEGGNSCGYVQFVSQAFWCGGHCYAVVPKNTHNRFLYHALKGQQPAIMGLRVGSGLPNVQKSALAAFTLTIPVDPAEQTAIAAALSDMDAEMSALEVRRDKTRALKQAMMQELLTGRTRLVAPAQATEAAC
jgi:type I restriction enzyme S subunit